MNNKGFITPTRLIFVFWFLIQFAADTYATMQVEQPTLFAVVVPFAFIWLFWLWLTEDSASCGISWPLDLGMFLIVAWPIVLPYHLFKTRGLKAFIPILAFILTGLCGTLAAVIVTTLLS